MRIVSESFLSLRPDALEQLIDLTDTGPGSALAALIDLPVGVSPALPELPLILGLLDKAIPVLIILARALAISGDPLDKPIGTLAPHKPTAQGKSNEDADAHPL